ncbi:MAG: fliP [Rickettsiales bacterium]|jgi:flagellar biosynthetic protein FliP|nr:fliP [Rickettsiales bacterium]
MVNNRFLSWGVFLLFLAVPQWVNAQEININLGEGGGTGTSRIVQLVALITVLSLAPSILVMVTSFTRIIIVLSFLRSAMGLQQTPPNPVLISLALFLTLFIMMPAMEKSYADGIKPLMEGKITEEQALAPTVQPFKDFMLKQVREKDLALFIELSGEKKPEKPEEVSIKTLIPAFMISELRRAFEIGFLVFIPFLIIDMMVASTLMAMGMMMLPPVVISLPFKLIFFVLIDGWNMIVGSLVKSFG